MKKMNFIKVLSGCCFLSLLFGCVNSNPSEKIQSYKNISYEIQCLTTEDELNLLTTRGDTNIVDWELSKEFAQLWLENGIEEGFYPVNSALWEIPIAVYDKAGDIEYYEFRVVSDGEVIAAITGSARKDLCCPIAYEFNTNGYADELTNLYKDNLLSENDILRVVDNGYPTIVFGKTIINRGDLNSFEEFVDPETGNAVNKDSISVCLSYDEIKEKYPEFFSEDFDTEKMQAFIEDYKKNGEEFWKIAVENKGRIADFAVRGSKKSERTEIDTARLLNTRKYIFEHNYNRQGTWNYGLYNYGPCGAVAAGFVLDFISANGIQNLSKWDSLSFDERIENLKEQMKIGTLLYGAFKYETLPQNLGNSVEIYSNYKVVSTSTTYPKSSINNNMPGISLRIFGEGFAHYRPVIGYKVDGWWIFSWPSMKILDLVDASDKTNGSWETYVPIKNFECFNIERK